MIINERLKMKSLNLTTMLAIVFFMATTAYAQTGTIKVTINQIDVESGGKVKIGVYEAQGFPVVGQGLQEVDLPVEGETSRHLFKNLSAGRYAVAVFQDANNNDRLDKNLFGVPKEPYGFSKNIFGTFGPPDFEEVSINLRSGDSIMLTISLE
jgi:uncharacterized protein (DUF2141 family)